MNGHRLCASRLRRRLHLPTRRNLRIEVEKAIEVFRKDADLPQLKGHHEVTIGKRGRTRFSEPVLDEIDRVLPAHYRFTDEVLDLILSTKLRAGITTRQIPDGRGGEAKWQDGRGVIVVCDHSPIANYFFLSLGLSTSLMPSPNRLMHSTSSEIAKPGKSASQTDALIRS